eukprot:1146522-Pelagomonas_calceolata.AAC.7
MRACASTNSNWGMREFNMTWWNNRQSSPEVGSFWAGRRQPLEVLKSFHAQVRDCFAQRKVELVVVEDILGYKRKHEIKRGAPIVRGSD